MSTKSGFFIASQATTSCLETLSSTMSQRPTYSASKASLAVPSKKSKKQYGNGAPAQQLKSPKSIPFDPLAEQKKHTELMTPQNIKYKSTNSAASSLPNPPKAAKKVKPKKFSPVLLGIPDGDISPDDAVDAYATKIGGTPVYRNSMFGYQMIRSQGLSLLIIFFLRPSSPPPPLFLKCTIIIMQNWLVPTCPPPADVAQCGSCDRFMYLLFQAYVPLENSPFERVVYVWACNQRRCMRRNGSFRVVRAHKLDEQYQKQQQQKEKQKNKAEDALASPSRDGLFNGQQSTGSSAPFALGDLWSNTDGTTPFGTPIPPGNILSGDDESGKFELFNKADTTKVSSEEPSHTRSISSDDHGESEIKSEKTLEEDPADCTSSSNVQAVSWVSIVGSNSDNPSDGSGFGTAISKKLVADISSTEMKNNLNLSLQLSNGKGVASISYLTISHHCIFPPEWPSVADIPALPAQYLYITEEVLEVSFDSLGIDLSKYQKYIEMEEDNDDFEEDGEGGGTWAGEAYEKQKLPKGVDRVFKQFTERMAQWPEQCVRYEFGGTALLYSNSDTISSRLLVTPSASSKRYSTFSTTRLPLCPHCGAKRIFELQLMPNILSVLPTTDYAIAEEDRDRERIKKKNGEANGEEKERRDIERWNVGMEWGTVLVFVCERDCDGTTGQAGRVLEEGAETVKYFEEFVLIQFEAD
ncbi:programmed cell death protein 2 [Jimgerdemannia flammicorona]|uniref:Programmed cell death protein 2 n=1 Tax=Jimgerdemannia flammicorona TaxID=994334 RepID=A0A433R0B6_9FUNG|nr:programmed cell death protein 2 [Jimgerdemannia flammicorona]